jgi:hypothetical protein
VEEGKEKEINTMAMFWENCLGANESNTIIWNLSQNGIIGRNSDCFEKGKKVF